MYGIPAGRNRNGIFSKQETDRLRGFNICRYDLVPCNRDPVCKEVKLEPSSPESQSEANIIIPVVCSSVGDSSGKGVAHINIGRKSQRFLYLFSDASCI